jgi:hypothetical protein
MASVLKVDKLDPQSGTALEIGTSGDTVSIPSGATLDISASTLTPPATMPASSGINFTALNATNLGSGTVPTARLGSGTASSSTFLAGDQTYKAAGGGKVLKVTTQTNTTNGAALSEVTTASSTGPDYALDITYTSGSLIQIIMQGGFMADAYGHTSPGVSAVGRVYIYSTTDTVPAEGSTVLVGSALTRVDYGNYDMHDLSPRNWGTLQNIGLNFYDSPAGTAIKYYLVFESMATNSVQIYANATTPYMAMAVEYDTS